MKDLQTLLSGRHSGVHWVGPGADAKAAARSAEEAGWDFAALDGGRLSDKDSLLDAAAKALGFPETFGRNWDALEDCLCDLSWRPGKGTLLFWEPVDPLASKDPESLRAAIEVFRAAATWWRGQDRPFLVLLGGAKRPASLPGAEAVRRRRPAP